MGHICVSWLGVLFGSTCIEVGSGSGHIGFGSDLVRVNWVLVGSGRARSGWNQVDWVCVGSRRVQDGFGSGQNGSSQV